MVACRPFAPMVVCLCLVNVQAWPQTREPASALPYDLAFDRIDFPWSIALAVAPGGERIAFEVQHPPEGGQNERYRPNGTPAAAVGTRIQIVDRSGGAPRWVCQIGNCWRPAWSPDGRRLAYYADQGGPPQLWVFDLGTARSRRLLAAAVKAKLWSGDEPRWSPDGRTIYVPLAPAGEHASPTPPTSPPGDGPAGVTILKSGREADGAAPAANAPLVSHLLRENLAVLTAVDALTGRSRVVVPADATPPPSVLRLSGSGKWLSYLSVFREHGVTNQVTTFDLAVVPAAGGAIRTVAEGLPTLNDYHRLNYAWHPTDDRLVYFKDRRLWMVDVGDDGPGQPRPIGPSLGDLAPTVHWFTRDGRSVVVGIDPRDDRDYGDIRPGGIAVVPLDGSTATRFAIDDQRWTYRTILLADERTVWQPDGQSVTLLLEERATGEKAAVRFGPGAEGGAVLWKGLARLANLTGGSAHDAIFGTYEDLATPPDLYRFTADFTRRDRISEIEPRLAPVMPTRAELFETTVPLHDGTLGRVRTAVLLPAGARRGDRLPGVVLMYPGGDVSRAAEDFGGGGTLSLPTLLLTSRGFAVILANLTLGPNREAGNPMQEMVDVLLPQVYRAAELGYVDLQRLGIGGQSFGGFGTAAIVSRTNLFRAAVAVSGIYDLAGTYGHMDRQGTSFWIGWSEGGQARMGTHPWANLRRYIDNSPYYQADRIFTPLLIVHGDADMAYHDGQKLFTALRRLDRPAQFASYAGQGHVISSWKRASAVDAAQRIVEFYRRHLGDPATVRHPVP